MKVGSKLKCRDTVNNIFDKPLFIEDNIYDVLAIEGEHVTLNHILYGTEYATVPMTFVKEFFTLIEE